GWATAARWRARRFSCRRTPIEAPTTSCSPPGLRRVRLRGDLEGPGRRHRGAAACLGPRPGGTDQTL
ncbi:MAG: hypothetical protein AVDCRST_MAG01-01-1266, partial [uncultured Rubrobacteraceae bacterium]